MFNVFFITLFITGLITFSVVGTYWCFRHCGLAGIFGWAFTVFMCFYMIGACHKTFSYPFIGGQPADKYGWGGDKGKDALIELYPELDRSKLPDDAEAQRVIMLGRMDIEAQNRKAEQILTDRDNLKRYESLGMSKNYWHEKYMYLTITDAAWRQYCNTVSNLDRKAWEGQWLAAKIKKDDVKASQTEEARTMYFKSKG